MKRHPAKHRLAFKHARYVIPVLLVVVGIGTLVLSKAATSSSSVEAEDGAMSSNASSVEVPEASSEKAVKFSNASVGFSTILGRAIPDTLYGVTTEDVSNLSVLSTSLSRHTKRPTTRIVFQNGTQPSDYSSAIDSLRGTSYIMGEILDSTAVKNTSLASYTQRTQNFVNTFGKKIDIYEIGNELNGEWVGTPATILPKVQAAYDVVEKDNASLNLQSAITLNYWPSSDCYSNNWEQTIPFAQSLSSDIKNGVDYVFLSFYETACDPRATLTNQDFTDIFNQLKTIFPHAKIGMGEIGAQGTSDGLPSDPTLAQKQQIANRYYGMHSSLKTALGPRYVGGYFWWYYQQDAVPYNKTNSLWPTLEQLFNSY